MTTRSIRRGAAHDPPSQFKRRLPLIAKLSHRTVNVDFRYPARLGHMSETIEGGALYMVSTPIGNLGDITRRARTSSPAWT